MVKEADQIIVMADKETWPDFLKIQIKLKYGKLRILVETDTKVIVLLGIK